LGCVRRHLVASRFRFHFRVRRWPRATWRPDAADGFRALHLISSSCRFSSGVTPRATWRPDDVDGFRALHPISSSCRFSSVVTPRATWRPDHAAGFRALHLVSICRFRFRVTPRATWRPDDADGFGALHLISSSCWFNSRAIRLLEPPGVLTTPLDDPAPLFIFSTI
jgi:hypothetical protein